jgi:hypothetical protein
LSPDFCFFKNETKTKTKRQKLFDTDLEKTGAGKAMFAHACPGFFYSDCCGRLSCTRSHEDENHWGFKKLFCRNDFFMNPFQKFSRGQFPAKNFSGKLPGESFRKILKKTF